MINYIKYNNIIYNMIFQDISNFNNTNDYLSIFNGCLHAD